MSLKLLFLHFQGNWDARFSEIEITALFEVKQNGWSHAKIMCSQLNRVLHMPAGRSAYENLCEQARVQDKVSSHVYVVVLVLSATLEYDLSVIFSAISKASILLGECSSQLTAAWSALGALYFWLFKFC